MTTKIIIKKRCPKCHEGEMKNSGFRVTTDWYHKCEKCGLEGWYDLCYPKTEIKYDIVTEVWED